MSLVLRVSVPLVLVVLALVPVHGAPMGCAIDPTASMQDDAGSGGDAAGLREVALRLPHGSFAGTLVAGVDGVPVDGSDWYGFTVGDGAERVMIDLDAYTVDPDLVALFAVDVAPPGASGPVATIPLGGNASFDGASGLWTLDVRITSGESAACEGVDGPSGSVLGGFTKNYALYFGCDPVCL